MIRRYIWLISWSLLLGWPVLLKYVLSPWWLSLNLNWLTISDLVGFASHSICLPSLYFCLVFLLLLSSVTALKPSASSYWMIWLCLPGNTYPRGKTHPHSLEHIPLQLDIHKQITKVVQVWGYLGKLVKSKNLFFQYYFSGCFDNTHFILYLLCTINCRMEGEFQWNWWAYNELIFLNRWASGQEGTLEADAGLLGGVWKDVLEKSMFCFCYWSFGPSHFFFVSFVRGLLILSSFKVSTFCFIDHCFLF